ncbi:MAG: hypothetical protein ACLRMX_01420 [Lachnospira eligens]
MLWNDTGTACSREENEYKDEIILANVNGKLKELGEEYIPDSDVTFVTTSISIGTRHIEEGGFYACSHR